MRNRTAIACLEPHAPVTLGVVLLRRPTAIAAVAAAGDAQWNPIGVLPAGPRIAILPSHEHDVVESSGRIHGDKHEDLIGRLGLERLIARLPEAPPRSLVHQHVLVALHFDTVVHAKSLRGDGYRRNH